MADCGTHLFKEHEAEHGPDGPLFLPLTLEMGSWLWVRKNPRQLFSPVGPFNPILPHRLRRVLRRHLPLIDFLQRAVHNAEAWTG